MGGGYRGGGAGYNGGAGSRTGLTTGNTTYGNTAFGRPGGNAVAYGMRDAASLNRAGMGPTVGSYGNFRTPSGAAMFGNSPVQGQSFYGQNMGQALSQANRAQARQRPEGLLGGTPTAAGAPAYSAVEQELALPTYQDPMAMYTTLTPPLASVPNVFNQNVLSGLANFRDMMNNRYSWGNAMPGPGPAATPAPDTWTGEQDVYWNGGASGGMTPKNSYNGYNPPSYRGSGPSPYDPAYSPGPGALSNQTAPAGTNPRGWGGWASPFR